ncbi:uncharacterized protein N7483_006505 [Penicillium malachiteum]|uniref:uncharacterized protein n=1 Tax=Penicillium malachiteum TaxID=1324776 RepID=UPI0025470E14|nr:uncharacterized protein N7483_006505 [Penicillium malachiteum]KAJ5725148.1 hypothetical protein N7483_006505 [Penicillium malachiteum]
MGGKRGKRSLFGRWRSKVKEDAPANSTIRIDTMIGNEPSAIGGHQPKPGIVEDLWQAAYESLAQDEKSRLDSIPKYLLEGSRNNHCAGKSAISTVLENVISTVRKAAKAILDTAYSMQSFIGSIVAADPTGHAASAWAVVSLGLKLTHTDSALQDALFETSEFLTRALGRYTLAQDILQRAEEKNHSMIKKCLLELYANILRYALEMDRIRNLSVRERIWVAVSVSDITGQPLSSLQQKIKDQEENLKTVVDFAHHIQSQNQGERLLAQIEQNTILIEGIAEGQQLSNLPFARKADYGTREDLHEDICLK